MLSNLKVTAVVVTYNRLNKLRKVLASLEAQSLKPESIVVVNNASTDGTTEYLDSYKKSSHTTIDIKIIHMAKNEGGAGGFARGMKEGYSTNPDYIWLFDDDGYPEPHALENLVAGYRSAVEELGPDVPFACSMVKYTDGSICEMNNPVTTWDWGRLLARGQKSVMVSSCSFVSVLIPAWVISKFGLPYKEYFIWFDDSEYTSRISKICPGIQVLDSIIVHDMGENKGVNFTMINDANAWKFAYGIRNQASYRLHHEGILKYALFCGMVIRNMHRGRVRKKLQLRMLSRMIQAIRFNPKIDYPA